ncbi:MAG: hypothetical protein ACE5HE_12250 [Phycisphaerae bacterium]
MPDPETQIAEVVSILGGLGIPARKERLGGLGGGLCTIRGTRTLFVDLDADVATQLHQCMSALAAIPEAEGVYLTPALRERIERLRASESR